MGDERSAKRPKIDTERVDANDAITFDLRSGDESLLFKPGMCHQLFGDDEVIVGHENPEAVISIDHKTFKYKISFVSESSTPNATQVQRILTENFQDGLEKDTDPGEINVLPRSSELGSLLLQDICGNDNIAIYYSGLSKAHKRVKAIHQRAQQLLVFFIDGATPIDQSEPEWDLYLAVKQAQDGTSLLVGFCTVYRMYAYPDNNRHRVSQLFVLPPFQKKGIGRLILKSVYKCAEISAAHDVIYEEPTDEVQALRERIELERSDLVPWLRELASQQGQSSIAMNGSAGEQLPTSLALGPEELARAQKELLIPKQQVRHLWEGLLMQQPAFQKEPGQFPLRGLVARRLVGKFSDTEKQAVGKQIFSFPDGKSFCMRRVPRSEGLRGAPVALEDKKEEGQSKEEREEAFDQAVEQRMQFLSQLAGV